MGENRYILVGFGVCALTFLVFGTVTSLIPNSFFMRMITPKPLDYVFLSLTSVLFGTYVALDFYIKEKSTKKQECTLVCGTVSGVLSFSCPLCNAILLYLFGVAAVSTYIEPLRPVLGVLGVGLLSTVVYLKILNIKKGR